MPMLNAPMLNAPMVNAFDSYVLDTSKLDKNKHSYNSYKDRYVCKDCDHEVPDCICVEKEIKHDKVESPSWYTAGGIQTIDYITAKGLNFNRGNVVKYTTRAGHKPGDVDKELEDLKKARVYLNHEIANIEKKLDK